MTLFLQSNLTPIAGSIQLYNGLYDIRIDLSPFELDGEIVKTAIRLERINFPASSISNLSHKTFDFPVNPIDGYIDGSIYLRHVHNPVDVTKIAFTDFDGESIEAEFRMKILFEFEKSGFEDMDCVIKTLLLGGTTHT